MNWYKIAELNEKQKQWVEYKIALFIENKFIQALELLKRDIQKGTKQNIFTYLKQVWPENKGRSFFLPDTFPKDISQYPITMQMGDNETYFINGVYHGMKFNPSIFDQITDAKQIEPYRQKFFGIIAHETEHIYNEGTSPQEGLVGTIRYLENTGEMKSQSRELAYLYIKNNPNDTSINNNKLIQMANELKDQGKANYYNYLIAFADPLKQEKYKEIADVKKINQNYVNLINQYFQQYKSQQNNMLP